ncbi:MAG TPA: hypothetical protein VI485_28220 [Vicinamibacterales bacterium]|nr:hypothetical protein [Vicinamibacterales bacterium]
MLTESWGDSANSAGVEGAMQMTARLTRILETEEALQHLSERVQGMMLMGQDRDDLKALAVNLARKAKALAAMCGDPSPFGRES